MVTGIGGYLGRHVARHARAAGHEVTGTVLTSPVAADAVRVDVRDAVAVQRVVAAARPDLVVHTAYRQGGDRAWEVCSDGAAHVAVAARAAGARLVHVSTDLVFSGRLGRPLREDDTVDPITAYGAAKAEAEERVLAAHAGALVVRTSLLWGGAADPGPQERLALDPAAVFFTDEVRSPIRAADLAADLLALAARDARGVLHRGGAEDLDRLAFARRLAAALGRDPATLRGTPGPPGRPKHCALDSARAAALLQRG